MKSGGTFEPLLVFTEDGDGDAQPLTPSSFLARTCTE